MTRKETKAVMTALTSIKNPNAAIRLAIVICEKQLATFDAMRGHLKDQWDADYFNWGGGQ